MKGKYRSAAEGDNGHQRGDMKDIVRREKLKLRMQDTGEIQMLTPVGKMNV